jgi:hypothetical protein
MRDLHPNLPSAGEHNTPQISALQLTTCLVCTFAAYFLALWVAWP